ncbi:tetratricopeptide repeat protein [Nocardia brasiliensis]|uniref:tetratricopeptide repeat protein n=1 Tax=Nocardia brasiliensis TaxID=37326 RepID=UPI0018943A1A|nr:tetratricopeptide repeat protein [Nocardia brasiliensis]MBF6545971.1 sel1 repeat family protein [Nocardia brasiliensis]
MTPDAGPQEQPPPGARRLPDGRLLIPWQGKQPDGTIAHGMVEIGPDDDRFAEWSESIARRERGELPDDAYPVDTGALPLFLDPRPDPVPTARERRLDALRAIAGRGDIGAMEQLAQLLREASDLAGAEQWFRRAAERGSGTAMADLGLLCGTHGRIAEAVHWLEAAVAAGCVGADVQLGLVHLERGQIDEAERWLRPAAEDGSPEALCNMGVVANRRGDAESAEQWYERAAAAGHPTAMRTLGLYLARRGEVERAVALLTEAIRRGRADAMAILGWLYLEQGDTAGGEYWLRRGADADDPDSMFRLALYLREQESVPFPGDLSEPGVLRAAALIATGRTPAQQEARRWLERAAALGHPQSLQLLHDL